MAHLTIVPTPIGNLKDITFRAIEVLNTVDLILAEDTRTSGKLLKHYEIETPMRPYHQHNEHKVIPQLLEEMLAGTAMALITDAGTPAISDPGFLLVKHCLAQNIKVETLPGAVAFIPALVNSGLPSDKFTFEGFLPQKKGRNKRLTALQEETRTMVFYESPHRLVKALDQFIDFFGADRQASVSRELTKLHEENINGNLAELKLHFDNKTVKGEIVIVIAGQRI